MTQDSKKIKKLGKMLFGFWTFGLISAVLNPTKVKRPKSELVRISAFHCRQKEPKKDTKRIKQAKQTNKQRKKAQ